MDPATAINYAPWFDAVAEKPVDAIARAFGEQFVTTWIDRYHRMCTGPTNVLEVPLKNSTYLFDFCSELIDAAELPIDAREDRTVGAYGISQAAIAMRDSSRIKGFPGSDERGDRGHLAAHAAGGDLTSTSSIKTFTSIAAGRQRASVIARWSAIVAKTKARSSSRDSSIPISRRDRQRLNSAS